MLDKPSDADPGQAGSPSPRGGGRRSLRSPREALQPDAAPPPPKPPKRKSRPLVATASGLLSFIGIAAIAAVVAYTLGLQRLRAPGPLAADKVLTIQSGSNAEAADQLADAGVIDNRFLMTAALWAEKGRGGIKAGEYIFRQSASLQSVIDTLISGRQVLHSLTIPEGLTSQQVVDRLKDNDILVGDITTVPAEGTLMPDTYKFSRGTTRDQVIRSMEKEQEGVLGEVWTHRASDIPIHSPRELVTLASIVEKETGRADERPRVAGVFVNRLAHNIPLQSDPTIVYGLVGGKGTLGRGILRSEIDQKTPYNTYQIVGLPQGPIANPGKAAMEAVANPSRTKDLYFVADGTGGHAFADNLDQHRLNVLRWRQIEKDAKDKASPDVAPAPAANPAAAPKSNQRGDAGPNPQLFGAMSFDISGRQASQPVSVTSFPVSGFGATPLAAKPAAASPTFDELDVEVAGMRSRDDPAMDGMPDMLPPEGPVGPPGSMQSFPVPASHLADQRQRAAALGLDPSRAGTMPVDGAPDNASTADPSIRLYGKGKIIDASEGTSFDPLKDHTYDLNSPKVVPAIKALPPILPATARN